ncbi:hypothetical protein ACC786_14075 [Rhizobium ruizarguesonis]|uniref:hypothetical protein n=1 Tax=Rhizobium ruizarguesonis TaxID=2081791 RepID=UPI001FE1518B|nr:hypothetical protein [Rhizobium ruizarguesonis]
MLQTDLEKVSLTADITSFEWGAYLKRSSDPSHEGAVLDADSFLTPLLSSASIGGNNKAAWCNKDFDALLDNARAETDASVKNALYAQAQQIAADESPWIPLANGLR